MVGVADSNSVEPTNFLQVFFSELNILLPKAIQSPKKAMVSFDIEVAKQSQFHLMSSSPLSSVDGVYITYDLILSLFCYRFCAKTTKY